MIVAIHQPEFMPWLGYFNKMKRADLYIVFDDVQFKKRYFENRNRIKANNQFVWVMLPVKTKNRYLQSIMDVEIDSSSAWQRKIWEKIRHSYVKTEFFDEFSHGLKNLIFEKKYKKLIDFNLSFIRWVRKILEITTPLKRSSTLRITQFKSSELIVEICKRIGANQYLCGPSGKDYLDIKKFNAAGIQIIWQEYKHPEYTQSGEKFIPYLSILDAIFNCGSGCKSMI